MDASPSPKLPPAAATPVTQPARAALRQIGHALGANPTPGERLEDLPAWTPEEAAAFERAIEEACERTEP